MSIWVTVYGCMASHGHFRFPNLLMRRTRIARMGVLGRCFLYSYIRNVYIDARASEDDGYRRGDVDEAMYVDRWLDGENPIYAYAPIK